MHPLDVDRLYVFSKKPELSGHQQRGARFRNYIRLTNTFVQVFIFSIRFILVRLVVGPEAFPVSLEQVGGGIGCRKL